MNIQAEKLELMKMILETDNPGIHSSVKKIFKKHAKKDFWETISDAQKEDIKKGIKEIDGGEIVDYNEFMNQHRK